MADTTEKDGPMESDSRYNHMTYTVIPGPKQGVVLPELLQTIAAAAKEHGVPMLKLTVAQRLALIGYAPEKINDIWQDIVNGGLPQKREGVHYIKACPGKAWCKYGMKDSLALGEKLEKDLMGIPLPENAKVKVGISGCPMNCCESFVRDLGIFGKREGWTVVFGGNGAGRPRIGDVIGEGMSDQQVSELAFKVLAYYNANAGKRERTARFMERTGLEKLRKALSSD